MSCLLKTHWDYLKEIGGEFKGDFKVFSQEICRSVGTCGQRFLILNLSDGVLAEETQRLSKTLEDSLGKV